ncbi:MAG: DUF2064 domain-containing protein [Luteimonas sp.]
MNGALAIFVKTPGHSQVKSRLAADCGARYAQDWYRHAAAAVGAVAREAQARFGLVAYWAVAEPDALGQWPGLPTIAQGEGGLGERMARVHAQLVAQHGFGILIGADAPQVSAALLGEAHDWLASTSQRLALGPADDGGFWLFGANVTPPLAAWSAVQYSAADTARDLRNNMHELGAWRTLMTLSDVDHGRDLSAMQHALQAMSEPGAEQRALAEWMREQECLHEGAPGPSEVTFFAKYSREGGNPATLPSKDSKSLDDQPSAVEERPCLRGRDETAFGLFDTSAHDRTRS